MTRIGWYVHHHGRGHLHRFEAVRAALAGRAEIVAMSEIPIDGGLLLSSDVPSAPTPPSRCGGPDGGVELRGGADPTAGGFLHWAPVGSASSSVRLAEMVDFLARVRPDGVVVDVSVETLLTCRLAGVPTIAVRQHGDRTDPAHRLGYATARRLLAPFPVELDDSCDPELVARTAHVGFVRPATSGPTTPDSTTPDSIAPGPTAPGTGDGAGHRPASVDVGPDDVVVLWGRGGGHLPGAAIDAVTEAISGRVFCAGVDVWADDDAPRSERVVELGWVAEPDSLMVRRPVVIASSGNNVVASVAATRCPFVAVPQDRPFGEQRALAAALVASGVAALRPDSDEPGAWADSIATARARRDRWSVFADRLDGADVAADVILETFA